MRLASHPREQRYKARLSLMVRQNTDALRAHPTHALEATAQKGHEIKVKAETTRLWLPAQCCFHWHPLKRQIHSIWPPFLLFRVQKSLFLIFRRFSSQNFLIDYPWTMFSSSDSFKHNLNWRDFPKILNIYTILCYITEIYLQGRGNHWS